MNDDTIKTLITVLGGGVLLTIIQQIGKRSDMTFADKVAQRAEGITELDKLRVRIDVLEKSVDEWQKKYYEQTIVNERLAAEHKLCLDRADRHEARLQQLSAELGKLKAGRE